MQRTATSTSKALLEKRQRKQSGMVMAPEILPMRQIIGLTK